MITFDDKVRGVIFGTAYGDAMGAVVEKLTYQEIKEKYGRIESTETKWWKADYSEAFRLGRMRGYGIVTDDTLMTLSLMNVYMTERRHLDAYDAAKELMREIAFRPRYIPEFGREALLLDRLFPPEKHLFNRHVLANCDPREGGQGNMVNCGAAMYISPVGIVNACNPKAAYDEAILFGAAHQVSYGLEAAGVLACAIAKAMEPNVTLDSIIETAIHYAKDGTKNAIYDLCELALSLRSQREDRDTVVRVFHDAIAKYSLSGDNINRNIDDVGFPNKEAYRPSRIYSIEELPIALAYSVLHEGNLVEAVKDGVSSGRDTDSIGVMVGAVLGAMHGVSAIPASDIKVIEGINKQDIAGNVDRFIETASAIIQADIQLSKSRQEQLLSMNVGR